MKLDSKNYKKALEESGWEYIDLLGKTSVSESVTIASTKDYSLNITIPLMSFGHPTLRNILLIVSDKSTFSLFKVSYVHYYNFILDLQKNNINNKYLHLGTSRCFTKNELEYFLKTTCDNFNYSN